MTLDEIADLLLTRDGLPVACDALEELGLIETASRIRYAQAYSRSYYARIINGKHSVTRFLWMTEGEIPSDGWLHTWAPEIEMAKYYQSIGHYDARRNRRPNQ